jgi:hypothetical protein
MSAAAGRRGERMEEHAVPPKAAAFPGRVPYETSDTPEDKTRFLIDPVESRYTRMKRGTITSARLHQEAMAALRARFKTAMLTLTYRPGIEWKPHHISDLIKCIREHCRRAGILFRGVWVAELQKRGAVHYHLLFWLPFGVTLPKPDKRGWWPHGMTNWKWLRKPMRYITKYVSKGSGDLHFPKGLRLYGAFGLGQMQKMQRRWWMLPGYIRSRFNDWREDVTRAAKGFVVRSTGEHVNSLYKFVGMEFGQAWIRLNPDAAWLDYFSNHPSKLGELVLAAQQG